MPLDEGDDVHRRTTLGTAKRIRFVDLLDECRPALAGLRLRFRFGGSFHHPQTWVVRLAGACPSTRFAYQSHGCANLTPGADAGPGDQAPELNLSSSPAFY